MRHPFSRVRRPLAALLAIGLLTAIALPGRSEDPKTPTAAVAPVEREKQIAEIEKRISELNKLIAENTKQNGELEKQLKALKAPPAPPAPAVAKAMNAPDGTIPDDYAKALQWRCIGPANMGGRITALAVFEADPTTYWVATASGGLIKTTNNGVSFEHQFDREATVSIGDVCVAPSNKDILWIGTGENNPRNSVSYGDGVYKSTDGGKSWKNMGLKKTYQIGKIIIHPKNPDIVYVGALGRLYGPNEERGVFKTEDGGKTWNRILYVDDKTGVIDMRMSPTNPNTLIVATWEHRRDEFDAFFGEAPVPDGYGPIVTHAPGTALYKTIDGGTTFKKLSQGLPTVKMGRIGLDWSRKNPNVVFAIIDTEKAGTGNPPSTIYMGVFGEDSKPGAKLTEIVKDGPSEKAGLKEGDVVLKFEGKDVPGYDQMIEMVRAKKVGDKVKLDITRGEEKKEITVTLANRPPEPAAGGGGGGGGGRTIVTAGFFGEDEKDGVKVTRLQDDSAATKAGLKVDDVVTQVDGKPIGEFRAFMAETAQDRKVGDKLKLIVIRGKDKLDLTVTLEEGRGGFGGGGGRGGANAAKPYATTLGGQRENAQDQQGKDGFQTGGVFRSDDAGDSWKRINSINPRPMYFSQIRVDPSDDKYLYVAGVSFASSTDGGKRFASGRDRGVHSDHHALWIDPRDGRHMIIGTDGGFYVTYDRGERWDHHNFLALGQFYHVCCDSRPNYKVYGGLQDNGSWGGPAFSPRGGIVNEDWLYVNGGDGFVCRVDPTDPDMIYAESQGGAMTRRNSRTGERAGISANRGGPGGGGPGGAAGGGGRGNRGGGGGRPAGGDAAPMNPPADPMQPMGEGPRAAGQRHRFNWNTPFILSSHNPSIFYCAGEFVFRSVKKGDELKIISPEITRGKAGSGTALSESPRNADVLWAGSDDGNVWITRDGGTKWTNVTDNIKKAGLPGFRWVSTIEASKYAEGRAYVCFDAHRSDDDKPYIFVTEDFGTTWKTLHANLPWGSTRCCREDIKSENVLYCGTEFGAWASVNRGASWTKISNNLPTVAVHEFAQHAITGELIAATHGRSIWIVDCTPIRQMSSLVLKEKAHLYTPATAIRWRVEQNRGMFNGAERKFVGQNPQRGATVYYSLTQKAQKVELKVLDFAGQPVRQLEANTSPGLHKAVWDLARLPNARPAGAAAPGGGRFGGGGGGGGGGFGGFGGGAPIQPGTYRVVLVVDGQEFSQAVRVEADPTAPAGLISADQEEDEDMDEEAREKAEAKQRIPD
jgi:photosystem II stability/assembly factor-like uncharacterized protein